MTEAPRLETPGFTGFGASAARLSRFRMVNQRVGFCDCCRHRFARCVAWRGSLQLWRVMNNAPLVLVSAGSRDRGEADRARALLGGRRLGAFWRMARAYASTLTCAGLCLNIYVDWRRAISCDDGNPMRMQENQMTKTITALDPNFKDKLIRKKKTGLKHALLADRKADVLRANENENVPDGQWPAHTPQSRLPALMSSAPASLAVEVHATCIERTGNSD